MKKIVLLVLDGLADLPISTTLLKEAKKPNLDYLARNGLTGELTILPDSYWRKHGKLGSHTLNIALLGFDPEKYPLKRGPLEAVGADIPYQEGHLAIRCNFATVNKDMKVVDRRADRNIFGLDEIVRYVNENININAPFIFTRTYGHRAVLIIKRNLSDNISSNDPHEVGKKIKTIEPLSSDAKESARIVQDFVDKFYDLAETHPKNLERKKYRIMPANYLLVRQVGNKLYDLPNFPKKWGLDKAVCLSENGVMKATCMLADFNAVTIPEMPMKESLEFIFDTLQELMLEYPFVYVHLKWTDQPAHDGDFKRKKEVIEAIDKKLEMFKEFDGILILTCDHITSTQYRCHMPGKVPLLVYGKGKNESKTFDEFSVKKGKLKNYTPSRLWKFVFRD
ncbi:MAG: hypothetical protein QXO27_03555 [Candidatus Aenigmatarchaeota archaeon]